MKIPQRAIALVLATIAVGPLAAQEVPAWVQEAEEQWFAAIEAGNISTLQRSFTEDAAIMLPVKTVRGRDRLGDFIQAFFQASKVESCDWEFEDVASVDRMVVVVTRSRCRAEVRQGDRGDTEFLHRMIKVYEQQADDTWLIVRIDAQPED
jgi:ketosteroid isomerase-like protein